MHDLRRTAITTWTKTANIQTVARLAGHSDTATTLKFYASVTDDQIEAVRAANAEAMAQVSRTSDPKVTPFGDFGASFEDGPRR